MDIITNAVDIAQRYLEQENIHETRETLTHNALEWYSHIHTDDAVSLAALAIVGEYECGTSMADVTYIKHFFFDRGFED